jgi:hypothetical protein
MVDWLGSDLCTLLIQKQTTIVVVAKPVGRLEAVDVNVFAKLLAKEN